MEVIKSIQSQLVNQKYAFIPAKQMRSLLFEYTKFSSEDENEFRHFWDQTVPQKDEKEQVIYPFKGTLVSFYSMDMCGDYKNSHRRMSAYNLPNDPEKRSFEYIDPTTSGKESKFRSHRQWPLEADTNPIFLGFQRAIFDIISKPSLVKWEPIAGADPTTSIYENMTTAFRVTKYFNSLNDKMAVYRLADPGPEGIHQDVCELTVVVLVNRENVEEESAGNRVWSIDQKCGKPTEMDVKSEKVLKELVMKETFDTLFLLDKEVKHEVLPIRYSGGNSSFPKGEEKAVRDVLTFNARRARPKSTEACKTQRCI